MTTSPKNQDALLYGAGKSKVARQPKTGELMWTVRKGHTVFSCELRDHGEPFGFEVLLLRDGAWFYARRWPTRAGALVEVDELKADQIAAGGTLLP